MLSNYWLVVAEGKRKNVKFTEHILPFQHLLEDQHIVLLGTWAAAQKSLTPDSTDHWQCRLFFSVKVLLWMGGLGRTSSNFNLQCQLSARCGRHVLQGRGGREILNFTWHNLPCQLSSHYQRIVLQRKGDGKRWKVTQHTLTWHVNLLFTKKI